VLGVGLDMIVLDCLDLAGPGGPPRPPVPTRTGSRVILVLP